MASLVLYPKYASRIGNDTSDIDHELHQGHEKEMGEMGNGTETNTSRHQKKLVVRVVSAFRGQREVSTFPLLFRSDLGGDLLQLMYAPVDQLQFDFAITTKFVDHWAKGQIDLTAQARHLG